MYATLVALVLSAGAQEVNLRNANLYLPVEDLRIQRPGVPLSFERAYNSRSNQRGMMGYGWSSSLEVSCQPGPDGTLLITEADGFVLRFTRDGEPRERVVERYVDSLVATRRRRDVRAGNERTDAVYRQLRGELIADPDARMRMGQVLQSAWLDPEPGTYISYDRGTQRAELKPDGEVVRTLADGSVEDFDPRGRLRRHVDAAGHGIRLDYDRDGRLFKVSHTEGGSITVTRLPHGLVSSVLDTEGREVRFKYDDAGDLVRADGPGERRMAYSYDDEHNLVAVRRPDGSGFQVSYDVEHDWVRALKVGDAITRYSWKLQDDLHYGCTVTGPDGRVTVHSFDDLEHRHLVERQDGTRTETMLSACCDKPLEVHHSDGRVTRYAYDRLGRLVSVEHPAGRKVRYSWHPQRNEILQAAVSDGRRFMYSYDELGNLVQAADGQGRKLELTYGRNGKVSRIQDEQGRVYTFTYDASGRPVEISREGQGTLRISYGLAGEIESTQAVEGGATRGTLYAELREVLALLEPATGQLR